MAEVLDASSLVEYAKGSVVSRTLIKRDSEHSAPFDALVHVLDGEAEIKVGGQPHRVKAGQMILMPAGIPHALRAVERFKMVLHLARAK